MGFQQPANMVFDNLPCPFHTPDHFFEKGCFVKGDVSVQGLLDR